MKIDRQTLFYSATRHVKCSRAQALIYFSRLTAINLNRVAAGKCQHAPELCYWGSEGLLIAGTVFDVANLPADICAAIAELLNTTNFDHIDVTFSVCTPIFNTSSHYGGIIRIFSDGSTQHGSANF